MVLAPRNSASSAISGRSATRAILLAPGLQLLLGHTKLESMAHYLGIEVDNALSISEQVEL
ncbi:hypothetical protein FEV16_15440 [Methylocystis sp. B8]|nr:hypothetical protein FEV16_15440 [Methylocystis sp. B8]